MAERPRNRAGWTRVLVPVNARAGIFFFFLLLVAEPPAAFYEPTTEPEEVSLVALLAAPERHRGKRVLVTGFVDLEFEGNAVYLHEDDFRHYLTKNGLWLALDGTPFARKEGRLGYAFVTGTFDPDAHGHMGLFGGTLRDVDRLEPIRLPPR